MFTVKLLPSQVPSMWDAIKFASRKAHVTVEEELPKYLNKLLHDLLSGKAQCFVRLSDERRLMAMSVTRIILDEYTGDKLLHVDSLYAFESGDKEQWISDVKYGAKFAKAVGCNRIATCSTNDQASRLAELVGFKERYRYFVREVD